jgi:hypothetical protein
MTGLEVYLWLCLDSILHLLGMAIAISVIGIIIYIVLQIAIHVQWYDESEPETKVMKTFYKSICKYLRISISIFIVSILGLTFVPSTKDVAVIYVLPKIINNENMKALPNEAVLLLRNKMQEWMKDVEKQVIPK